MDICIAQCAITIVYHALPPECGRKQRSDEGRGGRIGLTLNVLMVYVLYA